MKARPKKKKPPIPREAPPVYNEFVDPEFDDIEAGERDAREQYGKRATDND